MRIPFNKPYFTGHENIYIRNAVESGKISGDGKYTRKCHEFFQERYKFKKCLLTTSCTDALEMASILIDIKTGDEVIAPSYTFVSTVNAFVLRGAKIVFCDSRNDHPGMDENKLEQLITSKTKVIIPVHYAGVACDMDKIMSIANKHNLIVIEDAAQAIDSGYISRNGENKPLGSFGHLSTFSFHETKNIICGEGGMLVINDERFMDRAEIIREKGTNRSSFFRGEVNKYGWVDIGSSFLPSDILAAFLYAQLEKIVEIQKKRKSIWNRYYTSLKVLEDEKLITLPKIPEYATNNAHMFYFCCTNKMKRDQLIQYLKSHNIFAVFHYLSLHKSDYYLRDNELVDYPLSDYYADSLIRLPFYFELSESDQELIIERVKTFFYEK